MVVDSGKDIGPARRWATGSASPPGQPGSGDLTGQLARHTNTCPTDPAARPRPRASATTGRLTAPPADTPPTGTCTVDGWRDSLVTPLRSVRVIALVRAAGQAQSDAGRAVGSSRGAGQPLDWPRSNHSRGWGKQPKSNLISGGGGGRGCDVPAKTQAAPQLGTQAVEATAGQQPPAGWLAVSRRGRQAVKVAKEQADKAGQRLAAARPARTTTVAPPTGDPPGPVLAGDQQRRRRREAGAEAGHRDGGTAHKWPAQRYLDQEGRGAAGTARVGSGLGCATGHHPRLCGQGSKVRSAQCGAPAATPTTWSTRSFMHKPSPVRHGRSVVPHPASGSVARPEDPRYSARDVEKGLRWPGRSGWDPGNWASRKPFGIGEQRPNNYLELWQAVWENRDQARYAWRILTQGACDGCALGTKGMRDWTTRQVHLCNVRLRLLRLNTMPALDPAVLADVALLAGKRSAELRGLGRLPYPMLRRRGEPGFTRVSWDEALDLIAGRIRASRPTGSAST